MKINPSYASTTQFTGTIDKSVTEKLNMCKERYLQNISDKKEIDAVNKNFNILIKNLEECVKPLHEGTVLEIRKNRNNVDSFFFTSNFLNYGDKKPEHFAGELLNPNIHTFNWDSRSYKDIESISQSIESTWAKGMIFQLKNLQNRTNFNEILKNTEEFLNYLHNTGKILDNLFEKYKSKIDSMKGDKNANTESTK
mgnify:CR=1 FL=1